MLPVSTILKVSYPLGNTPTDSSATDSAQRGQGEWVGSVIGAEVASECRIRWGGLKTHDDATPFRDRRAKTLSNLFGITGPTRVVWGALRLRSAIALATANEI